MFCKEIYGKRRGLTVHFRTGMTTVGQVPLGDASLRVKIRDFEKAVACTQRPRSSCRSLGERQGRNPEHASSLARRILHAERIMPGVGKKLRRNSRPDTLDRT